MKHLAVLFSDADVREKKSGLAWLPPSRVPAQSSKEEGCLRFEALAEAHTMSETVAPGAKRTMMEGPSLLPR